MWVTLVYYSFQCDNRKLVKFKSWSISSSNRAAKYWTALVKKTTALISFAKYWFFLSITVWGYEFLGISLVKISQMTRLYVIILFSNITPAIKYCIYSPLGILHFVSLDVKVSITVWDVARMMSIDIRSQLNLDSIKFLRYVVIRISLSIKYIR